MAAELIFFSRLLSYCSCYIKQHQNNMTFWDDLDSFLKLICLNESIYISVAKFTALLILSAWFSNYKHIPFVVWLSTLSIHRMLIMVQNGSCPYKIHLPPPLFYFLIPNIPPPIAISLPTQRISSKNNHPAFVLLWMIFLLNILSKLMHTQNICLKCLPFFKAEIYSLYDSIISIYGNLDCFCLLEIASDDVCASICSCLYLHGFFCAYV